MCVSLFSHAVRSDNPQELTVSASAASPSTSGSEFIQPISPFKILSQCHNRILGFYLGLDLCIPSSVLILPQKRIPFRTLSVRKYTHPWAHYTLRRYYNTERLRATNCHIQTSSLQKERKCRSQTTPMRVREQTDDERCLRAYCEPFSVMNVLIMDSLTL